MEVEMRRIVLAAFALTVLAASRNAIAVLDGAGVVVVAGCKDELTSGVVEQRLITSRCVGAAPGI